MWTEVRGALRLTALLLTFGCCTSLLPPSSVHDCRHCALPPSRRTAATMAADRPSVELNFWSWRGQEIRWQAQGLDNDGPCVLLVHGLFVNSDHWRKNLPALASAGFRVYALDLLGSGYSSKPPPCSPEVCRAVNGENGRADVAAGGPRDVELGTASGGRRRVPQVDLAHPLGSVYNFYTWAEQLADFATEVMRTPRATLVCNSIGTISSLQAAIDRPDLFDGIFVVNPNFRELHTAESPTLIQPAVSAVQAGLRRWGQPLFNALAKPDTVKQILLEPYADATQVTDELVDVLLTPLLRPGSADVVFDTLSYSAGPLPEQQLQDSRLDCTPVVVCWGEEDPWTPPQRVLALDRFAPVERVIPLPGTGHCPHDEAPDQVNPLIVDFVNDVSARRK